MDKGNYLRLARQLQHVHIQSGRGLSLIPCSRYGQKLQFVECDHRWSILFKSKRQGIEVKKQQIGDRNIGMHRDIRFQLFQNNLKGQHRQTDHPDQFTAADRLTNWRRVLA